MAPTKDLAMNIEILYKAMHDFTGTLKTTLFAVLGISVITSHNNNGTSYDFKEETTDI